MALRLGPLSGAPRRPRPCRAGVGVFGAMARVEPDIAAVTPDAEQSGRSLQRPLRFGMLKSGEINAVRELSEGLTCGPRHRVGGLDSLAQQTALA